MADIPLDEKVKNWLLSQGYPLEMRTAEQFTRADFAVTQSEYYADPKTGVQREIDIHAYLQRDIDRALIRLSAIVECKAGDGKPWVVFASEQVHLADRARVVQRSANKLGVDWLRRISLRDDVGNLAIFQLPPRPGYGITAAFTDRVDVPYAALMAAAGAAHAESIAADATWQGPFFSIQFPIVVTEAPLFECSLGLDNKPVVRQVDSATITWRNPVYGMPHCIIHVLHASAVENFVKQMRFDFEYLLLRTETEIREAEKDLVKKKRNSKILEFANELTKRISR